jgi:ferredoxin
MTFQVVADPGRCQGHGKCVIECPEVFDNDEQACMVMRVRDIPDALRPAVQRSVDDCPEGPCAWKPRTAVASPRRPATWPPGRGPA